MANYRTHVTTSIGLGAAYGAVCHLQCGVPAPSAAIAAGLCSIGGILPDIDSDNAVVLRESLGLVAAVTPLLTIDRLSQFALSREMTILIAAAMYLAIRFMLGGILKHWTVHRGMWHSLPAAAIAGSVVFYLCPTSPVEVRLFKAGAMALGFVWHLLLDEIYALESGFAKVRVKKSFGTALKLWGPNPLANVFVYALLMATIFTANRDWRELRASWQYVRQEAPTTTLEQAWTPPRPRSSPPLPR